MLGIESKLYINVNESTQSLGKLLKVNFTRYNCWALLLFLCFYVDLNPLREFELYYI